MFKGSWRLQVGALHRSSSGACGLEGQLPVQQVLRRSTQGDPWLGSLPNDPPGAEKWR